MCTPSTVSRNRNLFSMKMHHLGTDNSVMYHLWNSHNGSPYKKKNEQQQFSIKTLFDHPRWDDLRMTSGDEFSQIQVLWGTFIHKEIIHSSKSTSQCHSEQHFLWKPEQWLELSRTVNVDVPLKVWVFPAIVLLGLKTFYSSLIWKMPLSSYYI